MGWRWAKVFGFAGLYIHPTGPKGRRPSDVQQWPSGQTEQALPAKGRANSELRNVAPQGEAAAEAPKEKKPSPLERELGFKS